MDITYRHGTSEDTPAVFDVFIQSLTDLSRRTGTPDHENRLLDPTFVARFRDICLPLHTYLAAFADQYWVAEREGRIVAYARSTLEDGVRELTDFFVLPTCQSAGLGCTLLERAFPVEGARHRVILASTDIRAQALYLRAGVYPRFAIRDLSRKPEPLPVETDLVFAPATYGGDTLAALRTIDRIVLDFERDARHEVFLRHRKAYLYYRGDQVVGYGYTGKGMGPMALLHESDYPAVLAHAENEAAERGDDLLVWSLPLINRAAVDYLLARKFQLSGAVPLLFMSDKPFGRFENYILCDPALVL